MSAEDQIHWDSLHFNLMFVFASCARVSGPRKLGADAHSVEDSVLAFASVCLFLFAVYTS